MAPGEKLFRLIEKIDAAINCAEIKIDEININTAPIKIS